jgi:hypothetical protein
MATTDWANEPAPAGAAQGQPMPAPAAAAAQKFQVNDDWSNQVKFQNPYTND